MRRVTLAAAATLLFILVCLLVLGGLYIFANQPTALAPAANPPASSVASGPPTENPSPVVPTLAVTSTPEVTSPTLEELVGLDVPRNDPYSIAARLKGEQGTLATPASPVVYKVGDQAAFWVGRDIPGKYEQIHATLRYITPHAYLWVENSLQIQDGAIRSAGDTFENKIYPTDRKYFGSEPSPGVDNDPHVFIINTYFNGASGYFSYADEYPTFINRFSNLHELFYMNAQSLRPGSETYASVLAHEFTHMIHWNQNKREGSWVTEGFGDLGIKLNGYPQDTQAFTTNPDVQLNSWKSTANAAIPNYEAAYLFLYYCLNRFGDGMIRDVISSGTHGRASIQQALEKVSPGVKFDDVYADWTVANLVNSNSLGPRYAYSNQPLNLIPQQSQGQYPASNQGNVHQYGTEYVELKPQGTQDATFTFDGSSQVKIIPADAHSGKDFWWGNRVDQSDTTLTGEFDLTGVSRATLNFWTWYDIESNYDYAYVEASADGGKTWKALAGRSTTTSDPSGENYGNGITCKSVSGCDPNAAAPQWMQEQMDLTPYAGHKVLIRFEYVTDATYVGPGLAVDDVSIPEINFSDDVEHGDNGWQAQGFARIDNTLPQRFIVQAIEYDKDGNPIKVIPVALDKSNHGTLTIAGFGAAISRVIITISGNTPITWEEANYRYTIQ